MEIKCDGCTLGDPELSSAAMSIPISLYVHMPWCVKKCPYCDFNSHQQRGELPETAYIDCLIKDFEQQLQHLQGRSIHTIFIGGGTPSLISPAGYQRLFKALFSMAKFEPGLEITMEANPGTVEQQHFAGYREAGINRLSIGIQSFQDEKLKQLGRIHNSDNAIKAVEIAKQAGFDNFNLDLMFGIPQQSLSDGLFDLQTAIDCAPTHISWYQLTLEPNTYFYKHPPTLPEDENIWKLQQQGQALLAEHGYQQYEVSAYAYCGHGSITPGYRIKSGMTNVASRSQEPIAPGYRIKSGMTKTHNSHSGLDPESRDNKCQHNLNYWLFGDYLGIGAGAHGKTTNLTNGEIMRYSQVKSPKFYLDPARPFTAEKFILEAHEKPLEFFLNAFRLNQEIAIELFAQRTGLQANNIQEKLIEAQTLGYLNIDHQKITLQTQGRLFLNDLLAMF